MLLGKRPRHPIKRTTSMTEFSFDDLSILHPQPPSTPSDHHHGQLSPPSRPDLHPHNNPTVMGLVSPRMMLHRRNSADFVLAHDTPFLRTCSLCRRRLAPGRDIFMYRGDSAYCSSECRQQQMAKDEWKEKCTGASSASIKDSNSSTAGSSVPAS